MPTKKEKWKWYGYAGHLCIGRSCAYHLQTRIGKFLISTVGDYRPHGDPEAIGSNPNYYFETMVFPCKGELKSGDPNILSWQSIDGERYAESIDAERGHHRYCKKYARR